MKSTNRCSSTFVFAIAIVLMHLVMFSAVSDVECATYSILDYGAVGDNETLNTVAINRAIQSCNAAGGGTVVVPAGKFLTGTIELLSNVTLYVETGAVIQGSPNIDHYGSDRLISALVVANNAENIAITGSGIIDGNGDAFMNMTRYKTVEPAEADYDYEYIRQGKDYMDAKFGTEDGPVFPNDRPHPLLEINNCRNFLVRDISMTNSPAWCVRCIDSDGGDFIGVDIINNPMIPNNDGIHLTSSRNIHISDFHFDGGDDAIIVTGFGDPEKVAENITVTNCTLKSRSAGVRVGYGDSDIRNCVFENLVIYSSNRGLGVFTRDSGNLENILFNNITISTRLHKGHWWGNAEPINVSVSPQYKDTVIGHMKNIRFSNIVAESENGIVVHGFEDSFINDVSFDNIKLRITNSPINDSYGGNIDLRPTYLMDRAIFKHDIPGFYCRFANGVKINDFTLEWDDGLPEFFSHGIECENFENLIIDGFSGRQSHVNDTRAAIALRNGKTVTIRNSKASTGTGTFLNSSNVTDERLFVNNDLKDAKKAIANEKTDFLIQGNLMSGK